MTGNILLLSLIVFQPPAPTLPTANDAAAVAVQDATTIATVSPEVVPFLFYVFVNRVQDDTPAAIGYAANTTLNFAGVPYRPVPVQPYLYRLRLDLYADRDEKTAKRLLDTVAKMRDAQFYFATDGRTETVTETRTVTTRETQLKAGKRQLDTYSAGQVVEVVKTVTSDDGARWCLIRDAGGYIREADLKTETITHTKTTTAGAFPAAYADSGGQLSALIELTGNPVPIISLGQFLFFGLATTDGGLYYDFRGMRGLNEKQFLARAGVNLDDLGDRNADQRVVLMRTPAPNIGQIEYAFSSASRASVGPGLVTITRDFFEGSNDPRKHPLENLVDRKHDGSEIILPRADGGLDYALFDGNGTLVDEAPPNLAADLRIPSPFLPRLQGAIACIRCHGEQGMFQPAANWITTLQEVRVGAARFDIFAAEKKPDTRLGDELQKLISLYSGDTTEAFAIARITHGRFSIRASGAKTEAATAALSEVYNRWRYQFWKASDILRLLGHEEDDPAAAADLFNQLVPPVATEPLRITVLRAKPIGLLGDPNPMKLVYRDVEAVFPEIATRYYNSINDTKKVGP